MFAFFSTCLLSALLLLGLCVVADSQQLQVIDTYQVTVARNSTVRVKTNLSNTSTPLDVDFGDGRQTPMSSALLPMSINPIYTSLSAERVDDLISLGLDKCEIQEVRHNFCPLSSENSFPVVLTSKYLNITDVVNQGQVTVDVWENQTTSLQQFVPLNMNIHCGEVQYFTVEFPFVVSSMIIDVVQSSESCSSSSGNVICPFGAMFLGKENCPSFQSYLMKQTFSKRGLMYVFAPDTSKKYVIAIAADMFSAKFSSDTEERNRLGDVPLSAAQCCSASWNYTIHVSFDDSTAKVSQTTVFVILVFCVPMILVLAYKFLQLTKTITWEDDDCGCQTAKDDEEAQAIGITDDMFVQNPSGTVVEGKSVEVQFRNRNVNTRLKRMPTMFVISQGNSEQDAMKKYEQHRNAEKTKFYWIAAIVGISMMIPAWAYALTLLNRDKSEQSTCHFNNACRADFNFLGLVTISQYGSMITNVTYILSSGFFALYVSMDNKNIKSKDAYLFSLRNDMNLFYALSLGMFFLGIFSTIYHTCPNLINYQFDLVFMHFSVLMTIVAIYRRRHILHSFKVGNYYFVFMSLVLAQGLGMFFLTNGVIKYFWIVVGILFMSALILILLRILFFTSESWKDLMVQMYGVCTSPNAAPTKSADESAGNLDFIDLSLESILADKHRLVLMGLLLIEEIFVFVYCVYYSAIPTDWVLASLALPGFTYLGYYVMRKRVSREGLPWKSVVFIGLSLAFAVPAAIFFMTYQYNRLSPIHVSRALNGSCFFLGFDYHDMWHLFSCPAILFAQMGLYHLDENAPPLSKAAVF